MQFRYRVVVVTRDLVRRFGNTFRIVEQSHSDDVNIAFFDRVVEDEEAMTVYAYVQERARSITPFLVRWALFLSLLFVLHSVVTHMHYRHCKRTIIHVIFWRKSTFCITLETISQSIEGVFDATLGNTQNSIISMIKF